MKKCIGLLWTNEEEEKMLNEMKENKTIEYISEEHKRTTSAIYSRLKLIAEKMHNEGKMKDEIKNTLNLLPIEKINNVIDKKKKRIKKEKNIMNDIKKNLIEIKNMLGKLIEIESKKNNIEKEICNNSSIENKHFDLLSNDGSIDNNSMFNYKIEKHAIKKDTIFLATKIFKSLLEEFGENSGEFYKSGEIKLKLPNIKDNMQFRSVLCEILQHNNYDLAKATQDSKDKYISGELHKMIEEKIFLQQNE
jgi:hypothetical protein